jgi:hypothetical protein
MDWPVTDEPGVDVDEFAPLVEVSTTLVVSAPTTWEMPPDTAEAK